MQNLLSRTEVLYNMYFITSNDFFSNRLQDVTNTLRHVTFSSLKVKKSLFLLE